MIYICEPSATVATIYQLRGELWRRRAIRFVNNEAAFAALTKGSSNAAVYDVGRSFQIRQLSFGAGAEQDLASLDELFCFRELSRLPQRTD